jgi:hypothetical protein
VGYDLANSSGGYHQWNVLGWWNVLNLARIYGWMPRGTEPPAQPSDLTPWDGNYFRNEGQRVSAEDAAAIADALNRLLDDPNREAAGERLARQMQARLDSLVPSGPVSGTDVLVYPLAFIRDMMQYFGNTQIRSWSFADCDNDYLRQFITFCGAGAFVIE